MNAANPLYMHLDWYFILAMTGEILVMWPWVRAYFRFPKAMEIVLARIIAIDEAKYHPLAKHPVQTKVFVLMCAHSHWIMASRALAHLFVMFTPWLASYYLGLGWLWLTLVPLIWGGLYSDRVTQELMTDSRKINELLRKLMAKVNG